MEKRAARGSVRKFRRDWDGEGEVTGWRGGGGHWRRRG
jgi:hypothetical protein